MQKFTKGDTKGVVVFSNGIPYRHNRKTGKVECFIKAPLVGDGRWQTSAAESARDHNPTRQQVLDAIAQHWPELKPFGQWGMLPAGAGCVRATKVRSSHSRYRLSPEGVVQGQDRKNKLWCATSDIHGFIREALNHFWPPTVIGHKVEFRPDRWRKGAVRDEVQFKTADGDWITFTRPDKPVGFFLEPELITACNHFWPDEPAPATNSADKPIKWSFSAVPEDVDIHRCLREGYDSGAREIKITTDGESRYYLHREVWPLVDRFIEAVRLKSYPWTQITDNWRLAPVSYLPRARVWEAERQAQATAAKNRKLQVTVEGVR